MDQNHWFYRVVNGMIRLMLAGAVFLLLLHSVFSTSFVGRVFLEDGAEQERTLNIADSPLKHLFFFVLLTAFLLVGKKLAQAFGPSVRQSCRAIRQEYLFWGCIVLTLLLGSAYVWMTQLYPGSDPAKVYAIVGQWRQGDFSAFHEGEYLFKYPFQSGIVLFFYLLSFPLGAENYVGFQLVNVVFLAVIYGLLSRLSGLFSVRPDAGLDDFCKRGKGLQTAVYVSLLIWTPLSFYVTYLYGILPGMAFSLGAVYFALRYLASRRYRYIAAASLCMGLATVIKMNCLIYLIAIACFLVYDAITPPFSDKGKDRRGRFVSLIFVACMCLSVPLCTRLANYAVERISGEELAEGEAMLSWVVMGLQEAPLGPGGYNGYNGEVFERNHYDTERINEECLSDLSKIMTRMSERPMDEGFTFFARKTAFQWNDPTFICLDRTRGRKTDVKIPLWLKSLIEGRGSVRLSVVLNYMQTWILLGMLLYLFLRWRKGGLNELMCAVVFLGGYLFHMVWESSASYTVPYFVLLVPYAVCGMAEWTAFLERGADRLRMERRDVAGKTVEAARKRGKIGRVTLAAAVLAGGLLVLAFTRTNLFDRTFALDDDRQGIDANDQFYQRGVWEKPF